MILIRKGIFAVQCKFYAPQNTKKVTTSPRLIPKLSRDMVSVSFFRYIPPFLLQHGAQPVEQFPVVEMDILGLRVEFR